MEFDTPPRQPRPLTFERLCQICEKFDEKYTLGLEFVRPDDTYAYLFGVLKEQNIDYQEFLMEAGIEPPGQMGYNDEEHLTRDSGYHP